MKIEIAWSVWSVKAQRTAFELAGPIGAAIGIPLMPGNPNNCAGLQSLIFEAPGISGQISTGMKGTGYYVRDIQTHLSGYGIQTEVIVNDMPIQDYAAQEEARVQFLKFHTQKAIDDLKKTRNWLKDKRFASIRQHLERTVRDVDLVGS